MPNYSPENTLLPIEQRGINLQFSQANLVTGIANRPLTRDGRFLSPNIR